MIPTIGYVHVTQGSTVNMRNAPSTSATLLTTINEGTKVIVWDSSDNGWFQVQYNTYFGYVMSRYIAVTEDGGVCIVSTVSGSLNIRKTPSTNAEVLYQAAKNSSLQLLDSSAVSGWYRVGSASGCGWAQSSYLTVSSQPSDATIDYSLSGTTNASTPMGYVASYETILQTLSSGLNLPLLSVTQNSHTWYKTKYNGIFGFIDGNYINL